MSEDLAASVEQFLAAPKPSNLIVQNSGIDDKKDVVVWLRYGDKSEEYLLVERVLARGSAKKIPLDPAKKGVGLASLYCRFDGYMRIIADLTPKHGTMKNVNFWWLYGGPAEEVASFESR